MEKKTSVVHVKNEVYIAKDGAEFSSSGACEKYEKKLEVKEKIKHLRKVNADFGDFGEWWFIETENDLENFKSYLRYAVHGGSVKIEGGEVGTWVSWKMELWDNGPDECTIVSLKSIQNEYNNLMEAIK